MNSRKLPPPGFTSAAQSGVLAHDCGTTGPRVATLAYDTFGSGPEKVIVLHSWMGDAKSFDAMKSYLDTDAFTYAFADLRGYGRSREIPGKYTVDEVGADTIDLAVPVCSRLHCGRPGRCCARPRRCSMNAIVRGLSHSAPPTRRPTSFPSRSMRSVVGRPTLPTSPGA